MSGWYKGCVSAVLVASVLVVGAASAQESPCKDIAEKIRTCEPFHCFMTDPVEKDFILTHTINGLDAKGRCLHDQTTPYSEHIFCTYDERSRQTVADLMFTPRQLSDSERKLMKEIFDTQCEVRKAGDEKKESKQ